MELTDYHAKLYAAEITRRCAADDIDKLTPVLADAQVDQRKANAAGSLASNGVEKLVAVWA